MFAFHNEWGESICVTIEKGHFLMMCHDLSPKIGHNLN